LIRDSPSNGARESRLTTHGIVLAAAYLALGAVVVWLALRGWEYYRLPLAQRARHPLYWQLKPGGSTGLLLGLGGAGMMTLMLLYSVRKRMRSLQRLGPLRKWLDFHILLGVYGPLFIVLHSSLKLGGLVSISFWSMVAVASSGVFGRFLYLQIPRTRAGDELSLEQVRREDERLAALLQSRSDVPEAALARLREVTEGGSGARSVWRLLPSLAPGSPLLRLRLRRALRPWARSASAELRELRRIALQRALLQRRLLLWDRIRDLFHYWHVFHKPFAIVMYVLMVVHIGVAWLTGYVRLPWR
jgi:hypothetical protein